MRRSSILCCGKLVSDELHEKVEKSLDRKSSQYPSLPAYARAAQGADTSLGESVLALGQPCRPRVPAILTPTFPPLEHAEIAFEKMLR